MLLSGEPHPARFFRQVFCRGLSGQGLEAGMPESLVRSGSPVIKPKHFALSSQRLFMISSLAFIHPSTGLYGLFWLFYFED